MSRFEVLSAHDFIDNGSNLLDPNSQNTQVLKNCHSLRPNSYSVEDVFFGDSGKGSVIAKLNHLLVARFISNNTAPHLVSLRFNGGPNAGHESYCNGKKVVTHQIPMGVTEENVIAVVSRGMVIHPEDFKHEIDTIKTTFGGELPGGLLVDENAVLALDTHRAWEWIFKQNTTGSGGSTNRGISPAYASFYERDPIFVGTLLDEDWKEKLGNHYDFYQKMIQGFGTDLKDIPVSTPKTKGDPINPVGTKAEFLDKLAECRDMLKQYSSKDIPSFLETTWKNPNIPITVEGAQGPGLDPYHGIYPDVTASRSLSRFINDATYNIIDPEELTLRFGVMKTTYMSSVGQRRIPVLNNDSAEWSGWIQTEFDETGRSTGRKRDIYPPSIPMATYFKKAAGFDAIIATHLDACRKEQTIRIVSHYTDKNTGQETNYLPSQKALDRLKPHYIEFPGWDGESTRIKRTFSELPPEAQKYLSFLGRAIAPVAWATTGPDLNEYLSFMTDL